MFGQLFVAALKIGGPIVGIVLLTDIALGILARTVPQLNILVLGFPVKIIVGMVTLLLIIPMLYVAMQALFGGIHGDILGMVRTLRGGG
jgi:flagellar biosynthetic protein FliR